MPYLENEWYFENTAGVLLTEEGQNHVDAQFNSTDVCPECGAKLESVTMMEGSFVACSKDIYHRGAKYQIVMGDFTEAPKLVRP